MIVRRFILALSFLGLVAHSLVYRFVNDDAYISFVFARNLAEHGQLVFNLGDRVEGYTNFLWTLILALVMKLGIPPEAGALVLSALCAGGTMLASARLVARLRGGRSAWDALPAALLAASAGFACWTSGGLETQLFTFLVTLGLERAVAGVYGTAGTTFALAAMTRPEGSLILAVALVVHYVSRLVTGQDPRRGAWRLLPSREELVCLGSYLALYVPYFAWRWWYYGWPLPNTFYVKAGGTPGPAYARAMLAQGLFYVWQWAWQSRALFALPLALWGAWRNRRFGALVLAITVVFLAYTVKVGGDFMGLHRFVMPLFVTTAVLVALGAADLGARLASRWRPAGALVAVVLVSGFAASQVPVVRESQRPKADRGIDRPGYLRVYAEDRILLGQALAPHVRPDDFAIYGGVGVIPYFARLPGIDVFGLVSEEIAHDVPPTRPRPGHQKWAPASMLLRYEPTLLLHCYDLHRTKDSYRLCGEEGAFRAAGYEPVTIHVPGMRERGEYFTFLKRKDRPWP